ncbi:MAG: cysteine hydrolase [Candidatus Thermoplasmatota archaeon]|jgi:nicotinamidase-related amidase|nr:cysteine hydrolase [Candidatus Thermoplasmatota archaeon]MCL5790909.1 cysteine hydrolase [Candidatus Thermoplasmatota archaeon]
MLHGLRKGEAYIIVDLVGDFVTGKFGSSKAVQVAMSTLETVKKMSGKMEILMTRDAHITDDPEFRIWGEHCVDGTSGSELYDGLAQYATRIIPKRHYDAFFGSDLDGYLRAREVTKLYISGISTDICVQHTVSGAFFRGYEITLVKDLCTSIDEKNHEDAVKRMIANYGVSIINQWEFEELYVEK